MSVEDKKRLGRRFFKGYTKLVESKYWYNHYVALIFGASPASNLGSLIAIDWKGNELISVTRFFGNNDNVKLYLGSNPETNMYELWLGLIGLDGDGSEFIIQSRESIDLDSKTVETLPSYLKVISISWQKNNDFSELGELMNSLKLFPFMNKGRLTGTDDLNNVLTSGIYEISAPTTGVLNGKDIQYGILIVFSAGQRIQLLGNGLYGNAYFRTGRDNGRWYDWVSIYWHKIYSKRELGGLLEINKIINGFTSESFSLHKGESKRIKANGILVICSQYYNLYPSIAVISPATKNIEYIGGYKEYVDGTLFTFTFKNDYTTIMTSKIEGVEGSRVPFLIAYQNLLP